MYLYSMLNFAISYSVGNKSMKDYLEDTVSTKRENYFKK